MKNIVSFIGITIGITFSLSTLCFDTQVSINNYRQLVSDIIRETQDRDAFKTEYKGDIVTKLFNFQMPAANRSPYQLMLRLQHTTATNTYSGTLREKANTYRANLQFKPVTFSVADAEYLFNLIEERENIS